MQRLAHSTPVCRLSCPSAWTTVCSLWLGDLRLPGVVVVPVNHANELDATVKAALVRLKDAGVQLLNQSVLLRGVNDSGDALAALNEALFACGVLPVLPAPAR